MGRGHRKNWAVILTGFAALTIASSSYAKPLPKPGVQIELTHRSGGWTLDYSFAKSARAWFFRRTKDSIDDVPWRSVSFHVETPGVTLMRLGHYDALYRPDGAPIRNVRISVTPFARPLRSEYVPALTFSDGGIAFYTDDFAVAPAISTEAIEALPDSIDDTKIEDVPKTLKMRDPGKPILLDGRLLRDQVTLKIADDSDGTYIFSGTTPLVSKPSFAEVIDPGLPSWIRTELDELLPRLMQLYTRKLGAPAGNRPMALVAWEGAERPGHSLGGSVLDRLVIMAISGQQMLTPNEKVMASLRWFFGHETAHFWIGETVRYDDPREGWITEGSADLLAIRAIQALVPDYDADAELQNEMTNCLKFNGAGKPLSTAESRGEEKAQYACGALLSLVAEAASKRRDQNADAFTFLRGLIDANRQDGIVTEADWLARFSDVAGPSLSRDVATFIDKGVPDPVAFWSQLFDAVGIKATRSNGALHLG
jgi:hypothetical protein